MRIDRDQCGTSEQLCGIKDVVYLLILEQSVGVDACAGDVEVSADERRSRRYFIADFVLKIACDLGDHRQLHSVCRSAQRSIFHYHCLKRAVSGALTDAEKRAVDARGAVQPCGGGVCYDLIKIVVTVPLEHFARCSRIVHKSVYDSGNAARQRRAGVRYAVAHRVAGAYFYRNSRLLAEPVQLGCKRNYKAVEVRAGDILEVAVWVYSAVQYALDYSEILVESLCAG